MMKSYGFETWKVWGYYMAFRKLKIIQIEQKENAINQRKSSKSCLDNFLV